MRLMRIVNSTSLSPSTAHDAAIDVRVLDIEWQVVLVLKLDCDELVCTVSNGQVDGEALLYHDLVAKSDSR